MDEQSRKEAAEIKKLPTSLLEYLPTKKWRLTLAALTAFIILLLIFLGQVINTQIRYARLETELNKYESLWQSQQISDYEYTIRASNDDGWSEVAVRVEDGIATSEELAKNGSLDIDSFDTVPDLFSIISKALREKQEDGINRLVIGYNGDLGYPTNVALRNRRFWDTGLFIPSQYSYSVYNFKILEPRHIRYARLEGELDRYENLWESKEISSYEYTLKARTDEAYSELSVRVEDGIATSEELAKNGSLDIDSFDTVPDLFSIISKALREKQEDGFNELDIQYNGDIGYPTYIALRDHYKLGDVGKYSYSIVDFKILEQGQTAK